MESVCICKICTSNYNELENTPYLLSCSHSVCKTCLYNLINFNKRCPFCNHDLEDKNIIDYKPNYEVIFIMRELSKSFEKCNNCQFNLNIPIIFQSDDKIEIICQECAKTDKFNSNTSSIFQYIKKIEADVKEKKIEYENISLSKYKDDLLNTSIEEIRIYLSNEIDKILNFSSDEVKKIKDDKISQYFYQMVNMKNDKIKEMEKIIDSMNKMNSYFKDKKSLHDQIEKYIKVEKHEESFIPKSLFSDQTKFNSNFLKSFEQLKSSILPMLNEKLEKSKNFFKKALNIKPNIIFINEF